MWRLRVGRLVVASAFVVATVATALLVSTARGADGVCVAVRNTAAQSVAQNGYVALTFNTEDSDPLGFHSTSSNTNRLTVPTGYAGAYLVTGGSSFAGNGNGSYRLLTLGVNGSLLLPQDRRRASTVDQQFGVTGIAVLAVGDFAELYVYQDSGGNLNVGNSGGDSQSVLRMCRIEADTAGATPGPTGTPVPSPTDVTIAAFSGQAADSVGGVLFVGIVLVLLSAATLIAVGLRR